MCNDYENSTSSPIRRVYSRGDTSSVVNGKTVCPGLELVIPAGQSPYLSYPFAIHAETDWPWALRLDGQQIYLHSPSCQKRTFALPCVDCASLKHNPNVCRIVEHIEAGAKEHTNWKWLSFSQLQERAERLARQLNETRLTALNTRRKLAHRARVLENHKRFLIHVASGMPALIRI